MAAFIKTSDHISVVMDDGSTFTAYTSNPNYDQILQAIKNNQWELAKELASPATQVEKEIKEATTEVNTGRVVIRDGIVFVDDTPMDGELTNKMLQMLREGFDVAPFSKFLLNLLDNPSYRAVTELYSFLEAGNLPITEDGCFLAYKRIKRDYTDIYSGRMDNSIGSTVEMPRNQVDEDKNQTCSNGLHFCSREYLPSYGTSESRKTVMIKINPADVVAIPSDYNNTKGRCCKYVVMQELTHGDVEEIEGTVHGVTPNDYYGEWDDDWDELFDPDELEEIYKDLATKNTETSNDDPEPAKEDNYSIYLNKAEQLARDVFGISWNDSPIEDMLVRVGDDTPRTFTVFRNLDHADMSHLTFSRKCDIRRVCRGERKSTGGYKWMWLTDFVKTQ